MSPHQVRPKRRRALQPLALLWLTLVWVALWQEVTVLTVVSGLLVGVLVCLAFPLPAVRLTSKVRPLLAIALVARFLFDVVHASVQVSLVVLRRRPVVNSVVAVDLESASDFVLTLVASMLSLVPGSIVVEARRSTHTLFLHVLDTPDRAAADSFRDYALAVEARVLNAFPARAGAEVDPAPPVEGAAR